LRHPGCLLTANLGSIAGMLPYSEIALAANGTPLKNIRHH